ncbi:MAG: SDR family NAD(P)-dependent oxidoreductase [Acidimicrobiales bacterium]
MSDFASRYGPWAVVTGAAQGVGLAFTEALLDRGVAVVLVDRDPRVVEVAAGLPGSTRSLVADLAEPGWIDALTEVAADLEVGLVVANAAVSYVGRFVDQPAGSRAATVAVNCLAPSDLAAWGLPAMVERGRGGFLATSSGSALAGTAGVATYSASKAYVLNLAEALGWELRGTGVDSLAVVAPAMDTPGWRSHPVAEEQMLQPAVEPRSVVEAALDHLPSGGWFLADPGLELVAGLDRSQRVDLLSSATTALYPAEYPQV